MLSPSNKVDRLTKDVKKLSLDKKQIPFVKTNVRDMAKRALVHIHRIMNTKPVFKMNIPVSPKVPMNGVYITKIFKELQVNIPIEFDSVVLNGILELSYMSDAEDDRYMREVSRYIHDLKIMFGKLDTADEKNIQWSALVKESTRLEEIYISKLADFEMRSDLFNDKRIEYENKMRAWNGELISQEDIDEMVDVLLGIDLENNVQ
jgi:predicted DNA-binding ArsR family transcriptional regulator